MVGLTGCWGWQATPDKAHKRDHPLDPHLLRIARHCAETTICLDADVTGNPQVYRAAQALHVELEHEGIEHWWMMVPGGGKTGLDDWLGRCTDDDARRSEMEDLWDQAVGWDDVVAAAGPILHAPGDTEYDLTPQGLRERQWTRQVDDDGKPNGKVYLPPDGRLLTNFPVQITESIELDDGTSETARRLTIEATVAGRTKTVSIPASDYARMDWVLDRLGPRAILEPGPKAKDAIRYGIQTVSDPTERQVYAQTGWRQSGGGHTYLHAGGGIGPDGVVTGVATDLSGALAGYVMPDPHPRPPLAAPGSQIIPSFRPPTHAEDVRVSLAAIAVGPDRITVPLLATAYRAPLGGLDFGVGIVGTTGLGKSELAALVQQHYGAGMTARALPGNWSSTANAIGELMFRAADAPVTIDDYVPHGSPATQERLAETADRVIRGSGNGAGRQRSNRDGTLRDDHPPRGLPVMTAEATPPGQSLRARMIPVPVGPGDVRWDRLTAAQDAAANGVYARALAGFLSWVAARHDDLWAERPGWIAAQRDKVSTSHRRSAANIASLAWGWEVWMRYAVDVGAVTEDERAEWDQRADAAWRAAAEAATASYADQSPERRYLALLASALGSGAAHVAAMDGTAPVPTPQPWGWRWRGAGEYSHWEPQGTRIGWTDAEHAYLDPEVAYDVATRTGDLSADLETLRRRLREAGLTPEQDNRYRVEGGRRRLLRLDATSLVDTRLHPDDDADDLGQPPVPEVSRPVPATADWDSLGQGWDTPLSQAESGSDKGRCTNTESGTDGTPCEGRSRTSQSSQDGPENGQQAPIEPSQTGTYGTTSAQAVPVSHDSDAPQAEPLTSDELQSMIERGEYPWGGDFELDSLNDEKVASE